MAGDSTEKSTQWNLSPYPRKPYVPYIWFQTTLWSFHLYINIETYHTQETETHKLT